MEDEIINLCPKGTRPYFTDRRSGGIVFKQVILKCNCDCLREYVKYHDSIPDQRNARRKVIALWNAATSAAAEKQEGEAK